MYQTNKEYAKQDTIFSKACATLACDECSATPPKCGRETPKYCDKVVSLQTKRQASKFRRGKGKVYKNITQ